MKREVDLIAEPGDRVEVRVSDSLDEMGPFRWLAGVILHADTRWKADGHENHYCVRGDIGDVYYTGVSESSIRKPQQP